MRFLQLHVQAFNRFRSSFTIPLDSQGLVLVEGDNRDGGGVMDSNGSGKSLAIVETLLWCLFGKMARYGDRALSDQACHPINGADVTVDLEQGGHQVRVHRVRPAKGRADFTLAADGLPMKVALDPGKRTEDVQALLGLDYRAFRTAVAVSGDLALAQGTFAEQMAVLEAVLRLDELGAAAERATKQASALEKERAVAEALVQGLKQRYDDRVQALGALQQSALKGLYEEQIATLRARLTAAEQAEVQAKDLVKVVSDQDWWVGQANQRLVSLRADQAIIARDQASASRAASAATTCPECQRPYESAEQIEQAKQQALTRLAELGHKMNTLGTAVAKAQGEFDSAEHKRKAFEEERRVAEALARQKDSILQDLTQAEQQEAAHGEQVRQAQQRLDEAAQACEAADLTLLDLATRLKRKTFWSMEFGRDALQAQLFQLAAPVLNQAATILSRTVTAGEIEVSFNTLRASRSEDLVRITGGNATEYEGLSGGERQRVNLIVALALRALARWRLQPEQLNLAVYDETFDRIDPAGLEVVAKLLHEEARTSTVFVVTHNPALKRLFPGAKVLRVVRENREAQVVLS